MPRGTALLCLEDFFGSDVMRQLWEAAFKPPPRAADAGAGDQSRFAVLPQNTEDELTLSEVHSKLDKALNFLQRDVGYALLDDVRPHTGGGVRLKPPAKANAAVPKGDRSCRQPKDLSPGQGQSSTGNRPKDLAKECEGIAADLNAAEAQRKKEIKDLINLLQKIFEGSGGRLRTAEVAQVYRRQASNFQSNGQLDRLFRAIEVTEDRDITWEEFQALYVQSKGTKNPTSPSSAPASSSTAPNPQDCRVVSPPKMLSDAAIAEIIVISPEAAKYAHYPCDLVLVSRFAQVLYKSILQDLYTDADAGITTHVEARKRCNQAICHDGLYKCVLQGVRLMHLCDYDYADVVLVLGYATVYFRSTFSSIGKKMSPNEAAHVVVLLIYLAHGFLLDETCPLRIWQKHIFRKYCTLKVLDAALFRLFQMRPGFKLRISVEEEKLALMGLSGLMTLKSAEDDAEANDAIKQLMGGISSNPQKPSDSKELGPGSAANGISAEQNSQKGMNGVSSGGLSASASPAAQSGSSSGGSNGRSPPGSGHSAERTGEVRTRSGVVVDRSARSSPPSPPTVAGGRVGEATSLLTSARSHREGHQRRSDRSSKEAHDGALPPVSHADIPHSSIATAVAK